MPANPVAGWKTEADANRAGTHRYAHALALSIAPASACLSRIVQIRLPICVRQDSMPAPLHKDSARRLSVGNRFQYNIEFCGNRRTRCLPGSGDVYGAGLPVANKDRGRAL